jgi:Fe-S cluster biogenesis protein NfuA
LMEHLSMNLPIVNDVPDMQSGHSVNDDDDEIVVQIKELLDTRVRPMVAMDGGDIVFDRFKDGVVFLHMRGACAGCPSSTATLKSGIENMLKHFVPEVQEVRPAAEF